MAEDRRGRRVEDLPDWARRFYEDYGSPNLDSLDDVFHGPLMDRKSGLRRDDLIEILLDRRMLPDDKDPFVRGMSVSYTHLRAHETKELNRHPRPERRL